MATAAVRGGGIQNNIPRKNAPKIVGSPFPLTTPGHDYILGYEGEAHADDVTLRQMSDYIVTDTPPLAGQFNNATLPQAPPLQSTGVGRSPIPVSAVTRITPSEKAVLHTSGKRVPVVKRVGGPSPTSSTPFHPGKPQPAPVQRTRPTPVALQTFHNNIRQAGSFLNTTAANGAGTLAGHAHADVTASRWATVKKGAAG